MAVDTAVGGNISFLIHKAEHKFPSKGSNHISNVTTHTG